MSCVLVHREAVPQAISSMHITCPRCAGEWTLALCAHHGHMMNQLITRGEGLTCVCGTEFPMLYNIMFGVL